MENSKPYLTLQATIAIFFLFFVSCSDEIESNLESFNEHFVPIELAQKLTDNLEIAESHESNSRSNKTIKEIESITPIENEENGNTVYYIINFKSKGFIILSADDRVYPILGYSKVNNFPINEEKYPNGLVEWLFDSKEKIVNVRSKNEEQLSYIKHAWNRFSIQNFLNDDNSDSFGIPQPGSGNEDGCENIHITKGPLLATTWGQGIGYNNNAPNLGCNNYSNGNAPTGCVATAMAQIMRYHQFPSTYNWNIMPNATGSSATSILMRDIGDAVNMNWGCNGSSADTENEVASSFINDFGYSSASYADYNHNVVKQQINWNRPVILRGGRNTGWWIFGVYSDGHAWVCDGYKSSEWCETGNSTLYLHMNWGWGSNTFNGYYAYNNWNPGSHTFNYKRGIVFNILP